MLTELSIKDFAIIDHIRIHFKEGLTVLTGETGAGKSIVIDAVQLLSGGRGSVEFIRHGQKKAELEGLFIIDSENHPIYAVGAQFGVDIDDGMVVLERTMTASGKSICRVNGKLVTLAILREFGKSLIDIHTQHETQSLMDADRHIELLDLYNAEAIGKAKEAYLLQFKELQKLKKRFKEWNTNEQEMAQRQDLLQFQYNELKEAALQPGEDDQLTEERTKLMNYERIYQSLHDAYNALYGEQKGLDWVGHALASLESASAFDEEIQKHHQSVSEQYYMLEDLTFQLSSQLDSLSYDPERLNEIEMRLNEINRLKKKYGSSVEEILEYASRIEEEIDQIQNRDSHVHQLEQQITEMSEDAMLEAKQLHDLRVQAASQLTEAIHEELKDLYLEKARFHVDVKMKSGSAGDPEIDGKPVQLTADGFDSIVFHISTNPGEPLKELHKVASGGELSRIMLALKRIFSRHQGVTSVIFDEVDTGVSGRVAQAIGEKIYGISVGSQVLCITHLPQVASMADSHLLIEKHVENNSTRTSVTELVQDAAVEEISRMMTGTVLTEKTKEHAKELITLAGQFKHS
ncbi:DNA repair protein RecN [Terribacillus halophilus]|jgi:DNA repair protein RecN (Recombination protein N)|uniref:DNA repair protein RecN n=1 Tax=Terribacillus halophilus TaxID=361279 RepID=UPI00098588C3|nr:DNA repair protein RecN [Terribacillus halophilus]